MARKAKKRDLLEELRDKLAKDERIASCVSWVLYCLRRGVLRECIIAQAQINYGLAYGFSKVTLHVTTPSSNDLNLQFFLDTKGDRMFCEIRRTVIFGVKYRMRQVSQLLNTTPYDFGLSLAEKIGAKVRELTKEELE